MARIQDGGRDDGQDCVQIAEAAKHLNVSADVVRKRIRRGTIPATKVDGRWCVVLDNGQDSAQEPFPPGGQDAVHTDGQDRTQAVLGELAVYKTFVASKDAEIDFLRGELMRKDHIIAGLVERVPQLAPSTGERSEMRSSPAEAAQLSQGRSWWQRLFGIA